MTLFDTCVKFLLFGIFGRGIIVWLWDKIPEYIDETIRWAAAELIKFSNKLSDGPEMVITESPTVTSTEPPPPPIQQSWNATMFEGYGHVVRVISDEGFAQLGAGCAFLLIVYSLRWRIRKSILRMRGIRLEAMQAGSDFSEGELPSCQVAVYELGTFVDTFVGFGLRFGKMLVVPRHVMKYVTTCVLKTRLGSVCVNSSRIDSRVNADIVYMPLTDKQWSMLGVTTAQTPKSIQHQLVSCAGNKGVSTGFVSKTDVLGIIKYSGSTVPGMSGAAYYLGNVVHGIHTGVSGDINIGVSSKVIELELRKIMVGESPTQEELHGKTRHLTNVKAGWDTTRLGKEIDSLYAQDLGWAQSDNQTDYDAVLEFESERGAAQAVTRQERIVKEMVDRFHMLSSAERESCVRIFMDYNQAARTAQGQSQEGEETVDVGKDFVSIRLDRVEEELGSLKERLDKLEAEKQASEEKKKLPKVPKEPQPVMSPKPHKCGFPGCYKAFGSETGLMTHRIIKQHLVGESAFSGDVVKVVATDRGFRKRPHWKKNSGGFSKVNSNIAEPINPSTSQQETPSDLTLLMQKMLKSFEEQQQAMVGLSSAIMQNCKV